MRDVRRIPVLMALVLVLAGVIFVDRVVRSHGATPVTAPVVEPLLPPHVRDARVTSSAWYCPGVPLGGKGYDGNDYGGRAIVANPTEAEITGVVTRYVDGAQPLTSEITVPPRDKMTIDLAAGVDGQYVSALIELTGVQGGGGAVVEQTAIFPAGESSQPCGSSPSNEWYFADGFTASDSEEDLVLTNPLADATVINVRFVTKDGERTPSSLQGYVLPAQSLTVIKIAEQGARGEELVGVEMRAQSGAFIAGRAQHYLGTGRLGFSMKLGSPATYSDWWVATGDYAGKPAEQIDVFNPGDSDATVSVLFSGSAEVKAAPLSLVVPAHRVIGISMANIAGLPEGRFVVSLSVLEGGGIVVEHAVTRQLADNAATSVDLGFPALMASTRWRTGLAAEAGTERAFVVLNITGVDATASIASIGPAGRIPIAGLGSISLPAGVATYVSVPPGVDVPQVDISATQPVLVSRLIPRKKGVGGRDFVPALPVVSSTPAQGNETGAE